MLIEMIGRQEELDQVPKLSDQNITRSIALPSTHHVHTLCTMNVYQCARDFVRCRLVFARNSAPISRAKPFKRGVQYALPHVMELLRGINVVVLGLFIGLLCFQEH